MPAVDTAKLIAALTLKDGFTGPLNKANKALNQFDAKLDKTQGRAYLAGQQLGTGIKNVGKAVIGTSLLIGTAVAGISAKSLGIAGDFEASLNTINTIARTDAAGIKTIGDGIRKVARDTGTSLDDLTAGYYDLLSAGIKTADAQNVLTQANTLAIGGLSTTAEAVDLLTTAINTYGGDASKAGQYTDVFAKAVERGKITAAQLAESFSIVGPLAASSGISIQELSAGFARLTSSGVPAAEAATQMRSALVALAKPTKQLEDLEKATKKDYQAIAGKQGLVVALQQMREDAEKTGVPLIDLFGRIEAVNFTLATTGPNFDAYNADLAAMGKAAGTAAGQMGERQKGLNFQIERLKALAKDAGITIGSALLPKITPLIEKLNTFISGNQAGIAAFGQSIANLFSDANIKQGAVILQQVFDTAKEVAPAIAASARITGEVIKTAVGLFNSLPPEIKALAISGLAINKLTGGLVTNIAGGLISAVISSFRGMMNVNAAVVNVNGAVSGGLPGAAAGGGKGLLATAAGFVAPVAAAAALIVGTKLLTDALQPGSGAALNNPTAAGVVPLGNRDPRRFNANGIPVRGFVPIGGSTPTGFTGDRAFQRILATPQKAAFQVERAATNIAESAAFFSSKVAMSFKSFADLYDREQKLLGFKVVGGHTKGGKNQIGSLNTLKGNDLALVGDTLAAKFARSSAPYYKSITNEQKALKGLQRAQTRAIQSGDTKTAASLGKNINAMKRDLGRKTDAVKRAIQHQKVTFNVNTYLKTITSINGRIFQAGSQRYQGKYDAYSSVDGRGIN